MALAPIRHRAETVREQNLRLELEATRNDVRRTCAAIELRLGRLAPAAVEIGPPAVELVISSLALLSAQRLRVTDE